jgi:xylan 1,4-beta-xylosidase
MDADHSNAFDVWRSMGKPEPPSAQQYAKLEAAGQLAEIGEKALVAVSGSDISLRISLPRQGVSLLRLDW